MTGESGFRMDANERVDAVLGEAVRPGTIDTEAEHRAVAAFRSARDEGDHRARTRRRDDWRPSARSRALVSLRAAVGAVLASLLLGGGALATMNTSRTQDGGTPPTADHRPPPHTTPPAERQTPPPLPRPKQTRTHPEAPNETKPKRKAKDEGGAKAKDERGAKAKDEGGPKSEGKAKSEAKAKSKPTQPKPPKKKTNKPR